MEVTNEAVSPDVTETTELPETQVEAPVEETTAEPTEAPEGEKTEEKAEEPAYAPDYNYSIGNDKFEFDEWVRESIKSKEHEDALRDLYTKAGGLDKVKTRYNELENQFQEVNTKYDQFQKGVDKYDSYLNNGDFKSFQNDLGIPDDMILKRAAEIFEYQDMSPEQRQAYDKQFQVNQNNYALQQKTQSMESELSEVREAHQKTLEMQRSMEVDTLLSSGEYSEMAKNYDAKEGKPGAFKQQVHMYGKLMHERSGIDKSPKDAIEDLMAEYNKHHTSEPQADSSVAQVVERKATIPNVGGGTGSPGKVQVKTIADLKRIRKEKFGE